MSLTRKEFEDLCTAVCRSFVPSYSKANDMLLLYYRLYNELARKVGLSEYCVNFNRDNDIQWYVYNISQIVKTYRSEPFKFQNIANEKFELARD